MSKRIRILIVILCAALLLIGIAFALRRPLIQAARWVYGTVFTRTDPTDPAESTGSPGSPESPDIPILDPKVQALRELSLPDYVEEDLIVVDGASRRGIPLEELNGIVIHYVGNPGTTAAQNRSYYNQPDSTVSSHFLIGLEGEVLLCVPLHEKSSASNYRNRDTISIEVCHPDDSGVFNERSYESLVKLTAFLLDACDLSTDDLLRHYDVTGKECPRHFVQDESAWEQFKADVSAAAGTDTE